MGEYIIHGGVNLAGELTVSGGKNAILPILAATVLNKNVSIIRNCPKITDVYKTEDILKAIGCTVNWEGNTMIIDSKNTVGTTPPDKLVNEMRSSITFLGSLLGRFGSVKIAYPGGCELGSRPIDLHTKALRQLGADIDDLHGYIECKTTGLRGSDITLDSPSVGATENIMLASVLAKETTTILNAAKEPEIEDIQKFLNAMGANVKGAGSDTIVIEGVTELHEVEHTVIPDRIVAGTYLVAAAITGGEVLLRNVPANHCRQVLSKLRETGCVINAFDDYLYLKAPPELIPPDKIKTAPFPSFPTDMQPQFMSLLTLAKGTSIINETVFDSRFKTVPELLRMGADISISGDTAIIKGVSKLNGARVTSRDLRGGASLILAGLAASGETVVADDNHITRGYEKIEEALGALGADIRYEA